MRLSSINIKSLSEGEANAEIRDCLQLDIKNTGAVSVEYRVSGGLRVLDSGETHSYRADVECLLNDHIKLIFPNGDSIVELVQITANYE